MSGFLCAAETLAMAPAPVGTVAASSSITRLAPRAAPAAESCPSLPDITTLSPDYTTLDNITSPQPPCHETASLPRHSARLTSHNVTCPRWRASPMFFVTPGLAPCAHWTHCHTVTLDTLSHCHTSIVMRCDEPGRGLTRDIIRNTRQSAANLRPMFSMFSVTHGPMSPRGQHITSHIPHVTVM